MTRIFRNIRKQLAAENKIAKYMRYAIGEIILVVIGILIAMQVNNWNQDRKTNNKIIANLKAVQSELAENIKQSDNIFEEYIARDSIKNLILNNEISYQEYKNSKDNGKNYWPVYWIVNYDIQTAAYDNLVNGTEDFPLKYSHIIDKLKTLYLIKVSNVDVSNQRYQKTVYENIDYFYHENSWAVHDIFTNNISDEQIKFYMNSPQYKIQVIRTMNDMINLYRGTTKYRKEAIDAYLTITDLLNNIGDNQEFAETTSDKSDLLKKYTGNYHLVSDSTNYAANIMVEISLSNNQLFAAFGTNDKIQLEQFNNSIFYIINSPALLSFKNTPKTELKIINGSTDKLIFEKQ